MKPISVILSLIAGTLSLVSGAIADPIQWKPVSYPFLPRLVAQKDPELCQSFLDLATDAYKGDDFEIDLQDRPWSGVAAEWIFSTRSSELRDARIYEPNLEADYSTWIELEKHHAVILSYDMDLDEDGTPEVLALMSWTWSWRGATHVLLRFDDPALFKNALNTAKTSDEFADRADAEIRGSISSGSVGTRNWTWEPPIVVKIDGRPYLVEQGEVYNDDTALSLYEIKPRDEPELVCQVELLPDSHGYSAISLADTPVGRLERLARDISGDEPSCGGTLHAQSRTLGEGGRVASRIPFRPWVVSTFEPYNDTDRVRRGIAYWGQQGPWNHRKIQQLPAALADATSFLTGYYQASFGLTPELSRSVAARNVEVMLGSFFVFSANYERVHGNDPSTRLRATLLAGAAPDAVDALLNEGASISNAYDGDYRQTVEPTLFYALEHPALVELLLTRGADVNARGNFGKTALMYAAQFNLLETAKLLIKHGIDPNAATGEAASCTEDRVTNTGRTALMYAAANADFDMIKLLLGAGADPMAQDSTGETAIGHVAENENLGEQEKAEIVGALRERIKPTSP